MSVLYLHKHKPDGYNFQAKFVVMKQSMGTYSSIGAAASPFADWKLFLDSSKAYFIKPYFGNFSIRGVHIQRNGDLTAHWRDQWKGVICGNKAREEGKLQNANQIKLNSR
jgi:hypothetical protein